MIEVDEDIGEYHETEDSVWRFLHLNVFPDFFLHSTFALLILWRLILP